MVMDADSEPLIDSQAANRVQLETLHDPKAEQIESDCVEMPCACAASVV